MTPAPEPPGEFQLLTSPGPSAIAIIRLCGPATARFCARHVRTRRPLAPDGAAPERDEAGRARPRVLRGELLDADSVPIDDILVTQHAGPPALEIRLHLHGSPGVVRRVLELLRAAGFVERNEQLPGDTGTSCPDRSCARQGAESGTALLYETAPPHALGPVGPASPRSRLGSLWPAPNAIAAEAWERLPQMTTLAAARWLVWQARELPGALRRLLDEPPDEARRRCRGIAAGLGLFERLARPMRVCIAGPPNAGKSTLINALAGQNVSLVSAVPGTTRDWVEAPGEALGFPVVWIDTAGLRSAGDELEAEGIRRTRRVLADSDLAVVVLDAADQASEPAARFVREYADLRPCCVVLNKCDLLRAGTAPGAALPDAWREVAIPASAARGGGLGEILRRVAAGSGFRPERLDTPVPSAFALRQALELLAAADASDGNTIRDRILRCIDPAGRG